MIYDDVLDTAKYQAQAERGVTVLVRSERNNGRFVYAELHMLDQPTAIVNAGDDALEVNEDLLVITVRPRVAAECTGGFIFLWSEVSGTVRISRLGLVLPALARKFQLNESKQQVETL
ncbi:MAG: hypothetical protein MHM6MM_009352 [Cercozoa sp. M6MM]